VRFAFQELVRSAISAEKLAQRLAEGLDAIDTEFAKFEGSITDERTLIAWSERRLYISLSLARAAIHEAAPEKSIL
jgi:hypothetical protein